MITSMLLSSALAVQQAAPESLEWDWSEPQRYYLETEVRLPYLMWLGKQFNEQARVNAFQLRLVTDCVPGAEGKRRSEVFCTIEEIGIKASGVRQEQGLLQPILEEIDERLTGTVVQLEVRHDGRLANIDLEKLSRRNRRVGRINENLRLVLTRAFAGLDLPMPRRADDPQWVQHDAWILRAPAAQGSVGTAQLVHQWGDELAGRHQIVSGGRAIIVPANSLNQYDARMTSEAWFDSVNGRLIDRVWTMAAGPTPSSALAEGTAGYPYLQVGRLAALGADQSHPVGETEELPPLDDDPTALQQWQVLGLVP